MQAKYRGVSSPVVSKWLYATNNKYGGAGTLIRLRCSCGRVEAQGSELAACREMQLTSTMQL